ncbi:MAG: DUF3500 domain-containing protein [Spirochaetaceae bacterium]|nr:DUF3500 domain-containing protein [Spirochaetaceae bacterium]
MADVAETGTDLHPEAASQMAAACGDLLDSLDAVQRARATFPYLDGERLFWYYPPLNRHGLPLLAMTDEQQGLARRVLEAALSEKGYEAACAIIDHELILREQERADGQVSWARDPGRYYFTLFGDPHGTDPWGWRAEGHHLSLHFSIWGERVISTTPFFFGSNPAEVLHGPKRGLRILARREDLAFQLMDSLDQSQRSRAVIYDKAPWDILTYNSTRAVLPREEGLAGDRLDAAQQEMLTALVETYVNQVRSDVARHKLEHLRRDGLGHLRVAWAGPVARREGHYYRIHGGNFLVEFDNCQNDANHVHSVWRDVDNDFAQDVLRDHLLLYHTH